MLTLRFLRTGRRNRAFFRIVLTEKSKPAKSGFNKILGWYDPKTKKSSFEKEEILKLVKNGAIPSNSLAKLLKEQKVTHKNIKFIPDTPKKAKVKEPARNASQSDAGGEEEIKKPEEKIEEPKEETSEKTAETEPATAKPETSEEGSAQPVSQNDQSSQKDKK